MISLLRTGTIGSLLLALGANFLGGCACPPTFYWAAPDSGIVVVH